MTTDELFVRTCRAIGAHTPTWVQGAGGNVSRKIRGRLAIKASGCRLDRVGEPDTWVECDDSSLRLGILGGQISSEERYCEAIAQMTRGRTVARASMETGFHSVLPEEWVLHFHPVVALLIGEQREWALRRGLEILEYRTPGLSLSQALISHAGSRVVVLKNHGVVMQGADPDRMLKEWELIEEDFLVTFGLKLPSAGSGSIGPLRIYFPDTAVFFDEIRSYLQPAGSGYRLTTLPPGDRGRAVQEIWAATQLLHSLNPGLNEIPADEAARLAGLPVEQYRRQRGHE